MRHSRWVPLMHVKGRAVFTAWSRWPVNPSKAGVSYTLGIRQLWTRLASKTAGVSVIPAEKYLGEGRPITFKLAPTPPRRTLPPKAIIWHRPNIDWGPKGSWLG